jgi:threonyl-tRNA synthetase
LDFLTFVYKVFGLEFTLELSTRPLEKFLGDVETWNQAEAALASELDVFAGKGGWKLNPGDGAFYGPKIDIHVFDALRREFQCATIQLDFQLPIRFNLSYVKEDGTEGRPVIVHRAILGSLERFIAILVENNSSKDSPKWPYWISPRPCIVISIDPKYQAYAEKVKETIFAAGLECDVDESKHTLAKKVAEAQVSGYNFILVVGEKEAAGNTVNIRTRDNVVHGEKTIEESIKMFQQLLAEYK